jgi:two-component system phosphate regulon sensor histidine kinase PhoR
MIKKRRLIWQLYPSFLGITLLSLLAVTWYASGLMREFFLQRTQTGLETQARLLEKQVQRLVTAQDIEGVQRLCWETAQGRPTRLTVILPNGKVIGDSMEDPAKMENHLTRPEISSAYKGEVASSVRFSSTLQRKMMYVAIPLQNDSNIVGVLRTSIAVTAIDDQLASARLRIIEIGCLIALLASVICLFISRRISRPIEQMRLGADRYARGELDHRLAHPSTLELAGLADAMNQMAAQLRGRIEAVMLQRNELEAVLSSMTEGVIALDLEDHIARVNQAAANLFNQQPNHMKGRSIQEVFRNQRLPELIETTAVTQTMVAADLVPHQLGERVIHTRVTPLRDADSKNIGTLLVLNDVTQFRRLENMRRDFAANVSHEIKTPLTAIKGFVETLQHENPVHVDQTRRFLAIIEKHVNRLAAIIDDLMHLSRIEREDEFKQIKFDKSRLEEIIKTAIHLCADRAHAKHITVKLSCPPELQARVDSTLLEQAAVNLLDNAVKYSPENSEIQISAQITASEILIRFQDKGIGIPSKHLPRLFERFYRVDKARSRSLGGTGLGLAIVKHIAQAHGGQVTVESAQGQGSAFTLRLPRELMA